MITALLLTKVQRFFRKFSRGFLLVFSEVITGRPGEHDISEPASQGVQELTLPHMLFQRHDEAPPSPRVHNGRPTLEVVPAMLPASSTAISRAAELNSVEQFVFRLVPRKRVTANLLFRACQGR